MVSRLIRNSLLVCSLLCRVSHAAVPSPESWFGHRMGADRQLVAWDKVLGYFSTLAKESDRIRIETLGKTVGGKPMIAAFIANSDTLRNLDKYRDIQAKLADPRKTSDTEALRLITEGKSVVLITCSIHSTEVASTMTAVEFAYNLLTKDSLKSRAILANTIFILVPSLNPDGVDIVRDWYLKTLGTPHEGTSPPELYHKYVGHDNNRDWYIFSQPETRLTISKLHNVWHPQIVYDVHQQGANASRMFVPPWMDPIDPNVDPILAQMANAIGATMASDLTASGRKGVAINALYDFWTPARHYQAYHGGMRILSESASAKLATPVTIRPEDINRNALGYDPQQRSWNYLEPWLGGEWKVRDIVDDQLITLESCLYQAAVRREDLLRAFYKVGQKAVTRSSPSAFVISSDQYDPGATKVLLDTLHFGQVEIERSRSAFSAGGKEYPAGSFVIRLQQPYGSFAKTLLERQQYPDLRLYPGGPPKRPYDVTAQTLPLLMGVAVDTLESPVSASLERVNEFAFPKRPTQGKVLASSDTDSWRAINQTWKSGKDVWRDPATGDFLLAEANGSRRLRQPRIGLYKAHVPSMDEGWTRWLLDNFGFRQTSVSNADIIAGDLNSRFDVLVFPEMNPAAIQSGHKPGAMPDEYVGGLGEKGTEALKGFVSRGGTAVFLNDSSEWAAQHLGLGVKNILSGVSNREFYAPGSLLNVTRQEASPLLYGMPPEFTVWFENSPAFEIPAGAREKAVVSYSEGKVLASGWLLGEKYLQKKAAVVDAPIGSGHVVLFAMRPQYRAQSYLTFKMFFNSLVYFE
ncbi:MAG: peptidase M14 [Bryobacteraceae bacterium]|nr:peptidase M14 [Bryobacteraceae bacterium]